MFDTCRKNIEINDLSYIADILCSTQEDKQGLYKLFREDTDIRDDVLDNPNLSHVIMETEDKGNISPNLFMYVGLRHSLRKRGIYDRDLTDYVASMCIHFMFDMSWKQGSILMTPQDYLTSLEQTLLREEAAEKWERVWCLHAHIGHYILFFTGLLPNVILNKMLDGEPSISHYEFQGSSHFARASKFPLKKEQFFKTLETRFTELRTSLNELATGPFM